MVRLALILYLFVFVPPLWAQTDTGTEAETFDVRLELVLDPRENPPMEGEMVLATVRGFYRETITNEELKLRRMSDFDWMQLKPDHWSEKQVDGLPTLVFERRIAIFPKYPGRLTILPIAHELEINNKQQQRQFILVRSEPVTIEVQAKPANVGSQWLPAKAIEMSDTWSTDPSVLEDGMIVKRRVVLRALGVPPELLPVQPPLREPWLITFTPPEERSVQLTPEGPVSTVVWVWSLRPTTGELGMIPPAVIPYFDTVTRQSKTITLPASPIGYASFADNTSENWRSDFSPDSKMLLAFVTALLITVFFGFQGRRFKAGLLSKCLEWIDTKYDFFQLYRYEKQKDTAAFRLKLALILKKNPALNESQRLHILKPVDARLFAEKTGDEVKTMKSLRKAAREYAKGNRN